MTGSARAPPRWRPKPGSKRGPGEAQRNGGAVGSAPGRTRVRGHDAATAEQEAQIAAPAAWLLEPPDAGSGARHGRGAPSARAPASWQRPVQPAAPADPTVWAQRPGHHAALPLVEQLLAHDIPSLLQRKPPVHEFLLHHGPALHGYQLWPCGHRPQLPTKEQ